MAPSNSSPDGDRSPYTVAALSIAPAAVGCALGLVLSQHLKRRYRVPLAMTFFAIGAAAVLPVAIDAMNRLVRGPDSRHGANRTLDEIRSHDGLPYADADSDLSEEEALGESTMVDFPRLAGGET